jgi:hypothetical protein
MSCWSRLVGTAELLARRLSRTSARVPPLDGRYGVRRPRVAPIGELRLPQGVAVMPMTLV